MLTFLSATDLSGADYINQCQQAGVPVPPDWGSSLWKSKGILTNEFISAGLEAEVFVYESTSPRGVCFALPRSSGNTIQLLGIICQGNDTSKACFWDNQSNDQQFPVIKGTVVPLQQFAGGAELEGGSGGVCTDCHAGENPFVVHPGSPLDLGAVLKPNTWEEPLVHPKWPQNLGPTAVLDSVALGMGEGSCLACHKQVVAGGFPEVSTELGGYCSAVLQNAVKRTMPPGNPGDPSYKKHVDALLQACKRPPQSPVSKGVGAVWSYTGTPCTGQSCPGWRKLDHNSKTVAIAAGDGSLYQLHNDGWIWRYTGTPCSGNSCPGWQRLDNNSDTSTIAAAPTRLGQLHNNGRIWKFLGTPCNGNSCPHWQRLDNNPKTKGIAIGGFHN